MKKRTSAAIGDPARVAFAHRTRNAEAIRDSEVTDEQKNPMPPSRAGAKRHSPKSPSSPLEPGDPAAVAAAHRKRRATHKKDAQALKR